EFRWVNTMLGNLETALKGTYHAIDHAFVPSRARPPRHRPPPPRAGRLAILPARRDVVYAWNRDLIHFSPYPPA
ncbi:MAG: hypothetical protein VB137_07530, partial [Burkholderia sp.]